MLKLQDEQCGVWLLGDFKARPGEASDIGEENNTDTLDDGECASQLPKRKVKDT